MRATPLNTKIKSIAAVTLPANDPYIVTSAFRVGDELALVEASSHWQQFQDIKP
jgi:hypothetical protein